MELRDLLIRSNCVLYNEDFGATLYEKTPYEYRGEGATTTDLVPFIDYGVQFKFGTPHDYIRNANGSNEIGETEGFYDFIDRVLNGNP